MSKYTAFNTIVRKKYNALTLLYNSNAIPKYFNEEFEKDTGAHSRLLTYINEPDATEVGFNATEQLTGYIQIGVFLPRSDAGLNFALNDLASQIDLAFPRSNFIDGDLKVEWLNVEREAPIPVDGHYVVNLRVNFRCFSSC